MRPRTALILFGLAVGVSRAAADLPRPGPRVSRAPQNRRRGETVFLLHGIGKSHLDMFPLARTLHRAGYDVVNWKYPSRRHSIPELADQLARVVEAHPSPRIHFVTHSMGGIVVRHYFCRHTSPATGRLVMIAPPNRGAWLASRLAGLSLYKRVFGPAGLDLREGEEGLCEAAGIPPCEYGIIAGGRGRTPGMMPFIPGDNDGIISVDTTRLGGEKDFIVLPYLHGLIQFMPRTIRCVLRFLESGRFTP